jgi:hypothetical protein
VAQVPGDVIRWPIQGTCFDISDGVQRVLDRESGRFLPVALDCEEE